MISHRLCSILPLEDITCMSLFICAHLACGDAFCPRSDQILSTQYRSWHLVHHEMADWYENNIYRCQQLIRIPERLATTNRRWRLGYEYKHLGGRLGHPPRVVADIIPTESHPFSWKSITIDRMYQVLDLTHARATLQKKTLKSTINGWCLTMKGLHSQVRGIQKFDSALMELHVPRCAPALHALQ
jgi:hypothetical protein